MFKDCNYSLLSCREADEVDQKMIDTMQQVTNFLFPDEKKPNDKNILHAFKDAVSDVIFNAIGTKTARKIASKVIFLYIIFKNRHHIFSRLVKFCNECNPNVLIYHGNFVKGDSSDGVLYHGNLVEGAIQSESY